LGIKKMSGDKNERPIFSKLENDLADDLLFAIYQTFTDEQLLTLLNILRRKEELAQIQTLAVILIRQILSWEELNQLEQQLLTNFLIQKPDRWDEI